MINSQVNLAMNLTPETVLLGQSFKDKKAALRFLGKYLAEIGAVERDFFKSLWKREKRADTYLGLGIAIPHSHSKFLGEIRHDKVVFVQVPQGLPWNADERVYLICAVAARAEAHLDTLAAITALIAAPDQLQELRQVTSVGDFVSIVKQVTAAETQAYINQAKPGETKSSTEEAQIATKFQKTFQVGEPTGIHARPAGQIVAAVKQVGVPCYIRGGSGEFCAIKSLSSIISLKLRHRQNVSIAADDEILVDDIGRIIESK